MRNNDRALAGAMNRAVIQARRYVGADTKLSSLERDDAHAAGLRPLLLDAPMQFTLGAVEQKRSCGPALRSDAQELAREGLQVSGGFLTDFPPRQMR